MKVKDGSLSKILMGLLFFVLVASHAHAQLGGAYTIDPAASASKSNYKDITSAISDMANGSRQDGGRPNGKGISGPVVFSIADGVYYEKLIIGAINGASATNTIRFAGKSKNRDKVIITDSSSSTSGDKLLGLSNTGYISFAHLSLVRPYKPGN